MDLPLVIFIILFMTFCLWRSWSFKQKIIGKTDQEFIDRITNDKDADIMLDQLSTLRSRNTTSGYLMAASSMLLFFLDIDSSSAGSTAMIAIFIGLAAICFAQSYSDDSKIKLIYLAKSLKQNNN